MIFVNSSFQKVHCYENSSSVKMKAIAIELRNKAARKENKLCPS